MSVSHTVTATGANDPGSQVSVDAWNAAHTGTNDHGHTGTGDGGSLTVEAFPIGSVFIAVVSTNPATLLGYGTWSAFAAGRVLVGVDSGDTDFDTSEETGGAKTVASAGTNATENTHTHDYSTVLNHTHAVSVTDPGHGHTQNAHGHATLQVQGGTTASTSGTHVMTSTATGGSSRATGSPDSANNATATNQTNTTGVTASTSNPAGGSASGTSASGSAHGHTFTGSATSVVQPYIAVYMWKRTA